MIKITCPLYIDIPYKTKGKKPKRYYINLNGYRNWHHQISNKVKKAYEEYIQDQIDGLDLETPVTIEFTHYKPTKRAMDKGNSFAVHSKFFYDALVKAGCIPDDNDDFIGMEIVNPTVYDKGNGRVEFIIHTKPKFG